LRENNEEDVTV